LLAKQNNSVNAQTTKKTINDYCRHIERRLDALSNDFEGKRHLLSLALNRVVLDGNTVRIKGIIPAYSYANHREQCASGTSVTLIPQYQDVVKTCGSDL
jgi:hypothetical protein